MSVRIGHLRQVVPDSLLFSWEMITQGTSLDGCRLEIEHVPAVVACGCGARTTLELPILLCGSCGGDEVELISGEELLVATIDVSEPVR